MGKCNKETVADLFCLYVSTTQVENTLLCIGVFVSAQFMGCLICLSVTLVVSCLFIPIFDIIASPAR